MPTNQRLSPAQVQHYQDEGYLIVSDLFTPAELTPLRQELEQKIDEKVQQLAAEGKITNLHSNEPFETRVARIFADLPENGHAILKSLEGVAGGGHCGIEMFNVITHRKLLAVMESLVGPEIVASSVYRIRPKLPGLDRGIVPWHQDSGYFEQHCDRHLIVTCWIPLIDATEENGCLQILPRVHKRGIMPHHTGGNAGFLVIEDQDLPNAGQPPIVAECPLGGIVLLTNLTPHCSTPNRSHQIRWSIDLRYQAADAPNNLDIMPDIEGEPATDVLMACYPPEADFLVQSAAQPQRVNTYEEFTARRTHYDALKQKHYPVRPWTPAGKAAPTRPWWEAPEKANV